MITRQSLRLLITGVAALAAGIGVGVASAADGVRVLRAWDEDVEVAGKTVLGRVELVFDYGQGLPFEQIYDDKGQLVDRRPGPRIPTPSREEIDEAIAIVTADPTMGAIIEAHKAYVDGGFILDEAAGRPCGPHSRCLQIFAFRTDAGEVPLFRAVVDLTKDGASSIVHRDSWDQGVPR
ncbi:MAG: hypothetical protein C3F15_09710 [Holophagae bacterium]|nr:MAG: hypothetical protein C3F15_09710 [Holophagae bacterium]